MPKINPWERAKKSRRNGFKSCFSDTSEASAELEDATEKCDFVSFIDSYYSYWEAYGSTEELLRNEGEHPFLPYTEIEGVRSKLWKQYRPSELADPLKVKYIRKCLPSHVKPSWL